MLLEPGGTVTDCYCTKATNRFLTNKRIRALEDSNPRHSVLETDVLPTELRTLIIILFIAKTRNFGNVVFVFAVWVPQSTSANPITKNAFWKTPIFSKRGYGVWACS